MSTDPRQQTDGENTERQTPPSALPAHPSLAELAAEIRQINTSNGWNVLQAEEWDDEYKVPGILALIHSEVSEALEGFRARDQENFVEEMADIVIRVLDCVGGLPQDFDSVVRAKLEKNRKRGYRHGGKRV